MKKLILYLSLLCITAAIISGCGKPESKQTDHEQVKEEEHAEPKPEQLIIWSEPGTYREQQEMLKAFEQKYGIHVVNKEMGIADEIPEQLSIEGPVGKGPDVAALRHEQIGRMAEEGLIQEMKVSGRVLSKFLDPALAAETYDGILFGLPTSVETQVFYYNKSKMKKNPRTLQELYHSVSKGEKGDTYEFIANWTDFPSAYGIIGGMGGYVFKENRGTYDPSSIGLSNRGSVKAAEFVQKWYENQLLPKIPSDENGEDFRNRLFSEGKAASMIAGPGVLKNEKNKGMDIGVSVLPKLTKGKEMTPFLHVKGLHVTAFTKYPYWSAKLAEFLANEQNAEKRYRAAHVIPALKLKNDSFISDDEEAAAISEQAEKAVPVPNAPEMEAVWKPMETAYAAISSGSTNTKKDLEKAVRKIKQNIQNNKE
ncbi:extracellular solute-binding protein [Bacillus massiliglaciei]|uniref:extracellular solute-binding protein n=1 Tax=Bacillus massiliglaciei TaxID=1816693 RepID=UPI0018FE6309|nr:extracellular solute-binding protein [Bacillus massiliglaciei]